MFAVPREIIPRSTALTMYSTSMIRSTLIYITFPHLLHTLSTEPNVRAHTTHAQHISYHSILFQTLFPYQLGTYIHIPLSYPFYIIIYNLYITQLRQTCLSSRVFSSALLACYFFFIRGILLAPCLEAGQTIPNNNSNAVTDRAVRLSVNRQFDPLYVNLDCNVLLYL